MQTFGSNSPECSDNIVMVSSKSLKTHNICWICPKGHATRVGASNKLFLEFKIQCVNDECQNTYTI
jgi:hypothetical protein